LKDFLPHTDLWGGSYINLFQTYGFDKSTWLNFCDSFLRDFYSLWKGKSSPRVPKGSIEGGKIWLHRSAQQKEATSILLNFSEKKIKFSDEIIERFRDAINFSVDYTGEDFGNKGKTSRDFLAKKRITVLFIEFYLEITLLKKRFLAALNGGEPTEFGITSHGKEELLALHFKRIFEKVREGEPLSRGEKRILVEIKLGDLFEHAVLVDFLKQSYDFIYMRNGRIEVASVILEWLVI